MIAKGLEFALGASASKRFLVPLENRGQYDGTFVWEDVVNSLKEKRPIVGTSECHAWVFAGYRRVEGWLELRVLDPAMGSYWFRPGEYRELTGGDQEPAGDALTETFFLPKLDKARPASNEPSIEPDSDDDGVRDFDEAVRFKTEVDDDDSDDDGVRDKEEIRASVFEPLHGWSIKTRNMAEGQYFPRPADTGRDFDGDGKMMERDPDSDNGGCKDGEEDVNGNGIRDPGETSNFDKSDDPTEDDGTCEALWTGTAEMRLWTRNPLHRRDIRIVAQLRLRETDLQPIADPRPAHGGRQAGARIGSMAYLQCQSMTLHETWRDELRDESGGEVMIQVLTAEGTKAIEVSSPKAGFIWRKSGDLDLTPLLGFDIPRGGGLYSFSGCDFEFQNDLEAVYTCSGSRSCYEPFSQYMPFTGPFGIGRAPLNPPIPCADPEIRHLDAGGQRMSGSYSYSVGDGICVTTHGAVTWSLCKVGTPCAPLPPLPGTSVVPP